MRSLILLTFLLCGSAYAADTSYEVAAQLAAEGAPQLSLHRVVRDQPAVPPLSPEWVRWERLRLSLLLQLERPEEILARAAKFPADSAGDLLPLYPLVASAALQKGDAPLARAFLAKWLWRADPTDAAVKDARFQVIRSYLLERNVEAAYLSMLRYRQDYAPLAAGEAAQFVEALLELGGLAEAATWLTQLPEIDPRRLLLRLKTGEFSPENTIAAAHAAMEPPPAPPVAVTKRGKKGLVAETVLPVRPAEKEMVAYWGVISQAAALRKDAALYAEAQERALALPSAAEKGVFGVSPDNLRQAYFALALAAGNEAQLLIGDEQAWLALAARVSPLASRALLAFLAERGGRAEIRAMAQERLVEALLRQHLDVAAARLFAREPDAEKLLLASAEGAQRDEVRIALGHALAARGEHVRAAECYLQVTGERARRLAADSLVRAGLGEDALRQVGRLFKAGRP